MISSNWTKLEESMEHCVEDVPVSFNHRSQGTQAEIEAIET